MNNITDKQLAEKIAELKETERVVKENLTTLEKELERRKNEVPLGVPSVTCERGEIYWYLSDTGELETDTLDYDFRRIEALNIFTDAVSAEKHSEMLLTWRMALVANANGEPIDIKALLPLFEKGWVAMDESGSWFWYRNKPDRKEGFWNIEDTTLKSLYCFDIKPAEDWRKSLMECGL